MERRRRRPADGSGPASSNASFLAVTEETYSASLATFISEPCAMIA
jgi:hypothetical protein